MASTTGTDVPSTSKSFLESPGARSWARQLLRQPAPAFGSLERRNALLELEATQIQEGENLHTHQQRAVLAPIRCLPVELLSKIFELTTHGAYFPDTSLKVLTLALVSHHWRKTVHSTASLWTTVKLYEGYARQSQQLAARPAALVRWLSNTKMAPLEILLFRRGGIGDGQLMWDAISPHMGHVKTLEVSLRSLSPAQRAGMFMDLGADDAPLLRTLRIEGFDDVKFRGGVIEELQTVPNLSQISSLTLKNVVIPLKLLFACPNLRSLEIDHCIDSPQSPDSEDSEQHHLPLLETLEISRDHTTHMAASVSLYHIFAHSPTLQSVTCGWYCQYIPFVFGAAGITRLNIEHETGVGRPQLIRENVVSLFQELGCLEELSISVLELAYNGPDTMGDASVVFEVLMSEWRPCPCLRQIKFECVKLNGEMLLSFSELRGCQGLPVQCRITTVDCLGVPDITDALHAELKEALREVEAESDLAIPVTTS